MMVAARRLAWVCFSEILCACAPGSPGTTDLQLRCDRNAGAWFQAQHPGGVTRETVDSAIHTEQYTFSDHYNPRLQRCFVIASEEISTVYPDRPAAGATGKTLMDLTSNTRLGQVVNPWPSATGALPQCNLVSKHCASTREWEELAAPYMER
jgi:hypothetical protein